MRNSKRRDPTVWFGFLPAAETELYCSLCGGEIGPEEEAVWQGGRLCHGECLERRARELAYEDTNQGYEP